MVKTNDRGSAHDTPVTEPLVERKSKGGRPRRDADGDSLEKLTIRLTPKLKLGLEILSRQQGRSASQVLEWTLQSALVNAKVQYNDSLWSVLNDAWPYEGWLRTFRLWSHEASLVSFEERHACSLVFNSMENKAIAKIAEKAADSYAPEHAMAVEKLRTVYADWEKVVAWAWPTLLDDANLMDIADRQSTKRLPLMWDLGLLVTNDAQKVVRGLMTGNIRENHGGARLLDMLPTLVKLLAGRTPSAPEPIPPF